MHTSAAETIDKRVYAFIFWIYIYIYMRLCYTQMKIYIYPDNKLRLEQYIIYNGLKLIWIYFLSTHIGS